MKNLYVCEKCGQTFEGYEDAYNCEYSHKEPWRVSERVKPTYKEGGALPQTVTVEFNEWQGDECVYTYATYKLAKCFSPAENAELERQRLVEEAEQERRHQEWMTRYEAEKAAKAQEAAQASEALQEEAVGA